MKKPKKPAVSRGETINETMNLKKIFTMYPLPSDHPVNTNTATELAKMNGYSKGTGVFYGLGFML